MATQEIREREIARIYERDGEVRPSVLVKEAKNKRSPIHDEFEWDDTKAGHEFRLSQARQLIRKVKYSEPTGAKSRYFHVPREVVEEPTAVDADPEGSYKPLSKIADSPSDYMRSLLELTKQRTAMDRSIRELNRAATKSGVRSEHLVTLRQGMGIVRDTLRILVKEAQEVPIPGEAEQS